MSALKENEKYLDSIEGRTKRLQATFQDFAQSEAMVWAIKTAISALEGALKNIIPILITIGGIVLASKWGKNTVSNIKKLWSNLKALRLALMATIKDGYSFADSLKMVGLEAAKAQIIIYAITIALTSIISIYQRLKRQAEERRRAAVESAEAFKMESDVLKQQKNRIAQLNKEINSNKLSQEELNEKKKELVSIQEEIIDKYGDEKEVIEALNKAINGQIDALDELDVVKAKQWRRENEKAVQDAINAVTHTSTLYFGVQYKGLEGRSKIKDTLKQFALDRGGIWNETAETISFANKTIDEQISLLAELDEILRQYKLQGYDVNSMLIALSEQMNKLNSETYQSHKRIFDQAVATEAITNYRDLYIKVQNAQEEFNEAMASGDRERIEQAKENITKLKEEVINALGDGGEFGQHMIKFFENMFDFSSKIDNIKLPEVIDKKQREDLDDYMETLDKLQSMYEKLEKGTNIDYKDIEWLADNYPELLAFIGDEIKLRENLKQKLQEEDEQARVLVRNKLLSTDQFCQEYYNKNKALFDSIGIFYNNDTKKFDLKQDEKIILADGTAIEIHSIFDTLQSQLAGTYEADLIKFQEINNLKAISAQEAAQIAQTAWDKLDFSRKVLNAPFMKKTGELNTVYKGTDNVWYYQDEYGSRPIEDLRLISALERKANIKIPQTYNPPKSSSPKSSSREGGGVRPAAPDLLKLDIDRYAELEDELNQVTNALERLELAQEEYDSNLSKSLSQGNIYDLKIQNLEEQITLYEKLTDIYNRTVHEQKRERSELANFLRSQGFDVYGDFDSINKITNYSERLRQMYDAFNTMPYKTDADKNARTLAKQNIEDVEKAYKRILELNDKIYNTENKALKEQAEAIKTKNKISDIILESSNDYISNLEHELSLLKYHNGSLEDKLSIYKQIKNTLHETANKLRELGFAEDSDKIKELQSRWIDTDKAELNERLKNSKDYIERKKQFDNWGADNEIKAWTRVIEWLKRDYPNAIEEIAEAERNLLEAQKEEIENIKNAALQVTERELDRLNRLKKAEEDYWDERIKKLKESNEKRERAIELEKLEERLANQRKEKVKRVWSESAGAWIYEVDKQAIKETEDEINKLKREMNIAALEKQRDKELKKWDEQIKEIERIQRRWEDIANSLETLKNQSLLASLIGSNWKEDILNTTGTSQGEKILTGKIMEYFSESLNNYWDTLNNQSAFTPVQPLFDAKSLLSMSGIGMTSLTPALATATLGNITPKNTVVQNTEQFHIHGNIILPNVSTPKDFISGLKSVANMRLGRGNK